MNDAAADEFQEIAVSQCDVRLFVERVICKHSTHYTPSQGEIQSTIVGCCHLQIEK